MAAYAVIARIGRVDPHLTIHDLEVDLDRDPPGSDRGVHADSVAVVVDEPGPPTLSERLDDQILAMREAFAQLTFYLFDPESWRR